MEANKWYKVTFQIKVDARIPPENLKQAITDGLSDSLLQISGHNKQTIHIADLAIHLVPKDC